jgi:hypothetical protein
VPPPEFAPGSATRELLTFGIKEDVSKSACKKKGSLLFGLANLASLRERPLDVGAFRIGGRHGSRSLDYAFSFQIIRLDNHFPAWACETEYLIGHVLPLADHPA